MNYGVTATSAPPDLRRGRTAPPKGARGAPAEADQRPLAHHPQERQRRATTRTGRFPAEPQENILYFLRNAPLLEPWQREVIRIVRKIAQYFLPAAQTQVMNEGWATFWHYTLMNDLYDEGPGHRRLHDGVPAVAHQGHLHQPGFDSPYYSGINPTPWASPSSDLRRICEHPTEEDKRWFPTSPAATG